MLTVTGPYDTQVTVNGWPLGYATQNVRSRIAARRGAAKVCGGLSMHERTAGSVVQPRAARHRDQ